MVPKPAATPATKLVPVSIETGIVVGERRYPRASAGKRDLERAGEVIATGSETRMRGDDVYHTTRSENRTRLTARVVGEPLSRRRFFRRRAAAGGKVVAGRDARRPSAFGRERSR